MTHQTECRSCGTAMTRSTVGQFCVTCRRAKLAELLSRPPRGQYLSHGLHPREADRLKRGRPCALCGVRYTDTTRRMVVDHDHDTGLIRGVLCVSCRSGLGQLGDDVAGLRAALEYLEHPPINKSAEELREGLEVRRSVRLRQLRMRNPPHRCHGVGGFRVSRVT